MIPKNKNIISSERNSANITVANVVSIHGIFHQTQISIHNVTSININNHHDYKSAKPQNSTNKLNYKCKTNKDFQLKREQNGFKGNADSDNVAYFSKDIEPCPIEKCIINQQIFNDILRFLEQRIENGGFLIGEYIDSKIVRIHAAVFPPQKAHSAAYCEFDSSYIVPVRVFLEESELNYSPIGWIHSHPGLSIFLSGTDKATFMSLIKQNHKLLAMVVDSFSREKAAVFANKSNFFKPDKIDFDPNSIEIPEEKIVNILNNLKKHMTTHNTEVITYNLKSISHAGSSESMEIPPQEERHNIECDTQNAVIDKASQENGHNSNQGELKPDGTQNNI